MSAERDEQVDRTYMDMAVCWSTLSRCKKKQVGCLIVKDKRIIADGFNGTPIGMDNACEGCDGETHWHVIHAEANAICKLAATGGSATGSTAYTTLSPCKDCSKLLLQSGIKRLVYLTEHSDTDGLDLLRASGVSVEMLAKK